jgi:hypothetical protein
MIILTTANSDKAKDEKGNVYPKFSFKKVIQNTVNKAEELGYASVVYDMGELGMGEPFPVENVTSNALFKPIIVKECMKMQDDIVVYIDGDAQLVDSIDEIAEDDYDIGVTLREYSEVDNDWYRANFQWMKYINAGVIFFRPTEATKEFIELWHKTTEEVGDDQVALNRLACPDDYPEAGSIATIQGVRIKFFPCKHYNYYYFKERLVDNIKIMHFKGPVRHFYPFTWRKRIYCQAARPILNSSKAIIKGIVKIFSFRNE